MKTAGVLGDGAAPGYGEREKKGVEALVVEAFAEISAVLAGIPLSDGVRESPIFDGMSLVLRSALAISMGIAVPSKLGGL